MSRIASVVLFSVGLVIFTLVVHFVGYPLVRDASLEEVSSGMIASARVIQQTDQTEQTLLMKKLVELAQRPSLKEALKSQPVTVEPALITVEPAPAKPKSDAKAAKEAAAAAVAAAAAEADRRKASAEWAQRLGEEMTQLEAAATPMGLNGEWGVADAAGEAIYRSSGEASAPLPEAIKAALIRAHSGYSDSFWLVEGARISRGGVVPVLNQQRIGGLLWFRMPVDEVYLKARNAAWGLSQGTAYVTAAGIAGTDLPDGLRSVVNLYLEGSHPAIQKLFEGQTLAPQVLKTRTQVLWIAGLGMPLTAGQQGAGLIVVKPAGSLDAAQHQFVLWVWGTAVAVLLLGMLVVFTLGGGLEAGVLGLEQDVRTILEGHSEHRFRGVGGMRMAVFAEQLNQLRSDIAPVQDTGAPLVAPASPLQAEELPAPPPYEVEQPGDMEDMEDGERLAASPAALSPDPASVVELVQEVQAPASMDVDVEMDIGEEPGATDEEPDPFTVKTRQVNISEHVDLSRMLASRANADGAEGEPDTNPNRQTLPPNALEADAPHAFEADAPHAFEADAPHAFEADAPASPKESGAGGGAAPFWDACVAAAESATAVSPGVPAAAPGDFAAEPAPAEPAPAEPAPAEPAPAEPAPAEPAPAEPAPAALSPADDGLLAQPSAREQYYHDIYQEFVRSKEDLSGKPEKLSYDRFVEKLKAQEDMLKSKHQCKDIRFEVTVKNNQVSLRPRIVP